MMMTNADDALIQAGKDERCRSLAAVFDENALLAPCTCEQTRLAGDDKHTMFAPECPRAIWERAAHTCRMSIKG